MRQAGHDHAAEPAGEANVVATPCASASSDCGMLDDFNADLRQFEHALDDVSPDLADRAFDTTAVRRDPSGICLRGPRSPPPTKPLALNLLNCVWLD